MPDDNGNETAQERMQKRIGECDAAGAPNCQCPAWAYTKHFDGFPMCVCGHTQWAHKEVR